MRTWLALSLAEVGRFDEAVAHGERARVEAEAAQQLYSIFYAISQLGRVHLTRGAPGPAVSLLEQSASLAEAWHIGLMRGACADHLARAYVLAGRLDAAGALLRACRRRAPTRPRGQWAAASPSWSSAGSRRRSSRRGRRSISRRASRSAATRRKP
jgi:hypothetical protein